MKQTKRVLVVGANGGVGGETCRALLRHGWTVRALARKPGGALQGVEWFQGDAMVADDVARAAAGVDAIVHGVNPPGYRGWERLVLPMLENTLAAAKMAGARVVLPGTIYNYGLDAFPVLTEDAAQHPPTRKGELRVAMEQRLARAAREGTAVLILRCGDFIGPRNTGNSWFSQGLVKPGKPVRAVTYPGPPALGHAWAYLPDVAETLARLLDRADELEPFASFHFGGYWLDGYQMVDAVRAATGDASVRAARFPWWMVALATPFAETLRELWKMRYLWKTEARLEDAKLRRFLGEVPATPVVEAVRSALVGAQCL
ncbi:NAD(P)H-binding protein [Dyella sp. BiH032]|uniref:NAD-dependent epimerase/dehydratase family protein n=1 Tax=Dyella sp. BiH032 TaxID=3075430 RepID=UPI002892E921|nr:NAD-dependent epimerase/dehydratase family protein [Dyella sp. BiH032]WNL47769.1 NAD(P)H-binding protein [Dyella sp. BiH032]